MGVSEDFGRITQFSVVTERGSEYNIVERENSRKMTANGGGGYYNITEPWGGYYNITEPLGEGGKENQANFIWHNQNHPIPHPS